MGSTEFHTTDLLEICRQSKAEQLESDRRSIALAVQARAREAGGSADAIINALAGELAALWAVLEGRSKSRAEVVGISAQARADAELARREAEAERAACHDYLYTKRCERNAQLDVTDPLYKRLLARSRRANNLPPRADLEEYDHEPAAAHCVRMNANPSLGASLADIEAIMKSRKEASL